MRCTNLIRNQRFCLSCDMHETGNLLHCIFQCSSIKKMIESLYNKLLKLSPQVALLNPGDRLKYILSCTDRDVTLLCLKSLSDIDSLHRVNYDLLKPIIFSKLNGNNSSQSVRGISGGQFISDLKLINCLFNWLLSVLVVYLMLTIQISMDNTLRYPFDHYITYTG